MSPPLIDIVMPSPTSISITKAQGATPGLLGAKSAAASARMKKNTPTPPTETP
jgi:hypothetical protein